MPTAIPTATLIGREGSFKKAGFGFKLGTCRSPEEAVAFSKDCSVICTGYLTVTEEIIGNLPSLNAVIRFDVGYECIDVEVCTRHGVYCCKRPSYCIEDVATMAVTLLLDLMWKVTFFDRSCRRDEWNVGYGSYRAHRLPALTVG